jgi:hypothetical protein
MLKSPPDPAATLEAEQRADDDGMPEHPAKAADPIAWAETLVEREKEHALGYPTHPVAQAWTDLIHSAARLVDSVRPQRPVVTASTLLGAGAGLAVYLLFMRNGRRRYYR